MFLDETHYFIHAFVIKLPLLILHAFSAKVVIGHIRTYLLGVVREILPVRARFSDGYTVYQAIAPFVDQSVKIIDNQNVDFPSVIEFIIFGSVGYTEYFDIM